MFRTIVKHSLRSFNRQKGYFLINLFGLALGLASSLLISSYVLHELSFDRFNKKSDRIYKLILNGKIGDQEVLVSSTASVIGPTFIREFPEVEEFCRLNAWGPTNIKYQDQNFQEGRLIEADSSFFRIFTLPLTHGNINEVLNKPNTAVISESTAKKIFGDSNPIDQKIEIGSDRDIYTVSGVMEDMPENSHFEANVILSFMSNPRSNDDTWLNNSFDTYFLLHPNTSPETVEEKIPPLVIENVGPELFQFFGATFEEFLGAGNKYEFYFQNLKEIHMDPSIDQPFKQASDPKYLIIFGSVALLIIIIAAINFMNLSTAQAARRSREVGLKKVAGSTKSMLVNQFLAEAIILAFLALIVAIILVKISLPYFNDLLNASFNLRLLDSWYTLPFLIVLSLVIGLLAGSYPAFYLSSASPLNAFKSRSSNRAGNGKLRSALVVVQFAASIILIIGTSIMYRQINYMLKKDPGYDTENLLIISRAAAIGPRIEAFKEQVSELSGINHIAAATALPNRNNNNNGYKLEGKLDNSLLMTTSWADYDFLETMGMEISEGRFFSRDFPADNETCIVNEAALREYEIKDISAARIISGGEDGELNYMNIIGVVKDFNFQSMQRRITPYIYRFKNENTNWGYIVVRLGDEDPEKKIADIKEVWDEFTNSAAMPYFFMDDELKDIYRQERQSASLTVIFALFALIVATLGLFGLTSFMLQQRTKEIGIRKAMGSSVKQVYNLIAKDIIILVSLAAVIGSPVIFYIANKWLENYHFRIIIGVGEFATGYLVALLIAIITITFRTLKAARANPTVSLRYE